MKFKKGHQAWNKGFKGYNPSPSTQFKKGEKIGTEHPSWKGGLQKNKNDCQYLWDGANKRIRKPRKIYKDAYGALTEGLVIYHIDGNKNNDELTNLEAISRKELLLRNNQKKLI